MTTSASCSESNTPSNTPTNTPSNTSTNTPSASPTPSVQGVASASPTPLPSLANTVIDSALRIKLGALDTHLSPLVISTALTVLLVHAPFRPIAKLNVYATTGPDEKPTTLLTTAPFSPDTPTIVQVTSVQVTSRDAGVLVVAVDSESGQESLVDRAWTALEDWALPPLVPGQLTQSVDVDDTPFIVSTVITAEILVDQIQAQALAVESVSGVTVVGVPGVRLYLTRAASGERLALVDEVLEVSVGSVVRFDALQCALPGPRDEAEAALLAEGKLWSWEVVVFNKAFESDQRVVALVLDETGLAEVVATVVATASVAVVVSTVTTTASAASVAQVAQVGVSAQGTTAGTCVSPMVMMGNLQGVAMTGSLQLSTVPRNYRSFATKMTWTNGNIGITPPRLRPPLGQVDVGAAFRTLQSAVNNNKNETVTYHTAVVTAGSSAPQLLYDTLIFFAGMFLASTIVLVVLSRRRTKPGRSQYRVIHKLVVGTFGLAYFGLTVAATLVLWTSQGDDTDKMIATVILLVFTIPFPVLGVVLYRKLVPRDKDITEEQGGWNWSKFEQIDQRTGLVLQSVVGETRRGCEWYGLLCIYRRLINAIALVLLMELPVVQCGVVLGLFLVSFCVNIAFRPFKGGLKSFDLIIETAGQVVVISTCASSLALHFVTTDDKTKRLVGQCLVFLQMGVIALSLFFTIVPLLRLVLSLLSCKPRTKPDLENPRFSSREPTNKLGTYESPRKMRRKRHSRESGNFGAPMDVRYKSGAPQLKPRPSLVDPSLEGTGSFTPVEGREGK